MKLDRESLLLHVAADERFADVTAYLADRGLSLDVAEPFDGTIGAWLESGAPGARSAWLDPADHLMAGFTARIRSTGATFEIRPAPRRATGPDLGALVLGLRGRMLALESAWLRVHRVAETRPSTEKFAAEEEPLGDDERALFDTIAEALR